MNIKRVFPMFYFVLTAALLSGAALALAARPVSADPGVIYVDRDAAGAGTGLSWTDAFTEVQSALAVAVAGDDIWVAEGVYYPNFDPVTHVYTSSRGPWFSLPNDVRLYGGFASGETALAKRDWAAHPTVLSGDIGRDDLTDARGVVTTTAHIVGDNAYTVLGVGYLSAASAVDGFFITGGQANGSGGNWYEPHRSGGGVYSGGGSATLRNLVVIGNYAERGGGAAIYNAGMTLVNLAVINNSAQLGGGSYNHSDNGTLINLTFSGNLASGQGGGVYFTGGSLALVNGIVWGNTAPASAQIYGFPTVTYSDVQGGFTGAGNIDADPLFVDAAAGDLRLQTTSPAVNAGSNAAVPADTSDLDGDGDTAEALPYDLGHKPRISGSVVDMGAYEMRPPLYVDRDAAGANNGASWADAFTDLQSGLAAAAAGDELWVAEGVYRPTAGTDRTISFALKDDVAIYGGFAGTETARSQRDWTAHVATLSGDIGVTGVVTDNAYHVVEANPVANAVLDGLTISGGYADGANGTGNNFGGGMNNLYAQITLRNVLVSDNYAAASGGGIMNEASDLRLVNTTFVGNTSGSGGGIYNTSNGRLELVNVLFRNNAATGNGGGMQNFNNVTVRLTNVAFFSNTGFIGGGMNNHGSTITLTNVTFANNTATYAGGGIANRTGVNYTLHNAILWGNAPEQVYNYNAATAIAYSVIQGGCPAGATCANVINRDPQFVDAANGDLHVRLSSPALDAGDNTAVPADVFDLDGDGSTAEALPYDLGGGLRFFDAVTLDTGVGTAPIVDMGAYEFARRPIFVDTDATGAGTGLSWTDAFTEAQSALAIATAGDEIWVAEGVYLPTTDADRNASFVLKDNVAIYGGFAATETSSDQRDWAARVTTLSGNIGATGVVTDNVYHVVKGTDLTRTAILDGFTISGGYADGSGNGGGGMYNYHGSPTVRNVTFSGNYGGDFGGGIYNLMSSSPLLANVAFIGNTCLNFGGGICNTSSSHPELVNVVFSGNSAADGGGICTYAGYSTLTNVTFHDNHANSRGGGMFNDESGATLVNVAFYGNSAKDGGGINNYAGSNITVTNASFANNSATQAGGGIYNLHSTPAIRNAILWSNTPNQVYRGGGDVSTIEYSDIQGGCPAGATCSNVIDSDPLFVNAPGGNLRLSIASPAVDAGDNTVVPADAFDLDGDGDTAEPLPYDLDGGPRISNGVVDMGAYEAQDAPDVMIVKMASTSNAVPGQAITYTLDFSNIGGVTATHVIITDIIPLSLTQVSGQWMLAGGQITRTAGITYAWSVSDLAPGQSGVITLTGVVAASALAGEIVNTAHITGADDAVSSNNSSTASITLNGPPTAVPDAYPTTEDTPLSVPAPGVLGNDSDPNGDALQAALVTAPARGTLALHADGSFIYTPTANLNGPDAFTYRAGDGTLWSDPATVSITVEPVNDPPAAVDDTANTSMNTPRVIPVLGNDTDLDGDSLTIAAVSAPSHGSAAISGAAILYTPTTGYLGEDWFSYTISDPGGLTDTANVTVTVGAVNHAPVAASDAVTTTQNTPLTINVLANDHDPDMDTLFITDITAPAHGSAAALGAAVVYTPALDYAGADTFIYIVSDGQLTDTASVSVTILEVDTTAPYVIAVQPANGAAGVTVTAPVVITFSEAISAATFAYTVSPDPGSWSAAWNGEGTRVTLSHNPFSYNTNYVFNVTAAQDLASNPLADAPYAWSFTTISSTDTTPPQVTAVRPADGSTDVAINAVLVITFSEPINTATFTCTLAPDPGNLIVRWNPAQTTVAIRHPALAYQQQYTVTITVASDLAGNPLADAPYAWSFSTAAQAAGYRIFLPVVMRNQ